jgi:hypothetical protein
MCFSTGAFSFQQGATGPSPLAAEPLPFQPPVYAGPASRPTTVADHGAALAALAVGTVPGKYARKAEVQEQVKLLREYFTGHYPEQSLHNRIMLLWASTRLEGQEWVRRAGARRFGVA